MGWDFKKGASRADIIANCTKGWSDADQKTVCLSKQAKGNHLWTVFERTYSDGRPAARFIVLFLMASERGYGWGYKDVCASSGPCELTCPLSYLDMAPCGDGPYEAAWRDKVREHHAACAVPLALGSEVALAGHTYTVRCLRPLHVTDNGTGRMYRLPRKLLARAVVTAPIMGC